MGARDMLRRLIRTWSPTHLVMAMDCNAPTFRHVAYSEYKGNREGREVNPTDLLDTLKPYLDEWGIAYVESPGFEADDIMATLAVRAAERGSFVSLLTRDSDLLQLLNDRVQVLRPRKGEPELIVNEEVVLQELGISPKQIVDYKALRGDSSDNIPRVSANVGGKIKKVTKTKASEYLRRFGSLEELYKYLYLLPGDEGDCLARCKEQAFFFRSLIQLRCDVPLQGLDPRASALSRSVFLG